MPIRIFFYLSLFLSVNACSQEGSKELAGSVSYDHPIPFQPRQYLCFRTMQPIRIDGKLTEESWSAAPWTVNFADIEGSLREDPPLRTRAKMLWDDNFFYIAADIEEPDLWGRLRQRDTIIYYDDDFEVFIDPDGDGLYYYEFEMNALNTVWELLMLYPYRIGDRPNYLNSWDMRDLQSAVQLRGTLNDPSDRDEGWTVEIALPWEALKELAPGRRAPRDGEQWRVNFSRVDWPLTAADGQYRKRVDAQGKTLPENNWVWSPQGYIDMHRPETWGYVQFSSQSAKTASAGFTLNPEEKIKWGLWQLFHQQSRYYDQLHRYSAGGSPFTIPEVDLAGYDFAPTFQTTATQFEIIAPAWLEDAQWRINQEGRVWKE